MLKSFAVAFLFAPVAAERLSIGKTKFINAMVSFMDVSMARGEIPAIKELLQSLGEGTWTNTSNFTSALEDIIDLVDDQITHVMELQVEAKKAIDGNKATVQSSHAVASDALAAAKNTSKHFGIMPGRRIHDRLDLFSGHGRTARGRCRAEIGIARR